MTPLPDPVPARRRIIHVDMDAFYASVEQRDDPGLRGVPWTSTPPFAPCSVGTTMHPDGRWLSVWWLAHTPGTSAVAASKIVGHAGAVACMNRHLARHLNSDRVAGEAGQGRRPDAPGAGEYPPSNQALPERAATG